MQRPLEAPATLQARGPQRPSGAGLGFRVSPSREGKARGPWALRLHQAQAFQIRSDAPRCRRRPADSPAPGGGGSGASEPRRPAARPWGHPPSWAGGGPIRRGGGQGSRLAAAARRLESSQDPEDALSPASRLPRDACPARFSFAGPLALRFSLLPGPLAKRESFWYPLGKSGPSGSCLGCFKATDKKPVALTIQQCPVKPRPWNGGL